VNGKPAEEKRTEFGRRRGTSFYIEPTGHQRRRKNKKP
jgi:hypothetical protein